MAIFNVIHASDFHLGSDPNRIGIMFFWDSFRAVPQTGQRFLPSVQSTFELEIGRQAAKFIIEHREGKDALIISGDIACTGSMQDLRTAENFLDGAPHRDSRFFYLDARLWPTIKNADIPVFLVPGNHDRFDNALGAPGGINFDTVLVKHWPPSSSASRVRKMLIRDPYTDEKLCLLGADFTLFSISQADDLISSCGQGAVIKSTLDVLERYTIEVRQRHPGVGVVWITHFPCVHHVCSNPQLRLINCNELLDAAERLNIRLLLSGHVHESIAVSHNNLQSITAGSAMALPSGTGLWLHTLEIEVARGEANLSNRTNYRWSEIDGKFI